MFCKGEYKSIYLLLSGFEAFSQASGLQANKNKSAIYFCNMEDGEKRRVLAVSGFIEGKLPFRYLGVPIIAGRLSIMDSECLVDKIVMRIKTWGSRNLSYSGRLILVNSVLMSLFAYWSFIFILPKGVLKRIISVCRAFLWEGKVVAGRIPLISWDTICRSKKQGGLGVRDCIKWNIAAVGKLIWNIAQKKDVLWVRWVNHVYLKDLDIWAYSPNQDTSWSWRKICAVKDNMATGFNNGVWMHSTSGEYTIKSAYQRLMNQQGQVYWHRWVWNSMNVPKYTFICWLFMHDRLQTKQRLFRLQITEDDVCPLCLNSTETQEHLFFDCSFSAICLKKWKLEMKVVCNIQEAGRLWRYISRNGRFPKLRRRLLQASLTALIYHIWSSRNTVVWEKKMCFSEKLVEQLMFSVRNRVMSVIRSHDRIAIDQWL